MLVRLICLIACVGTAVPLRAETLEQLMQQARLYDSRLEAARTSELASGDVVAQARAKLLPQLSLQYDSRHVDNSLDGRSVASYHSNNSALALRQTLFNWGDWQGYQQSKLSELANTVNLAQAEQDLRLRLANAYFAVLAGSADVELLAQRTAILTDLQRASTRRFEEGKGTLIDVRQADADLSSVRTDAIAAQGRLDIALGDLGELVGHPVAHVADLALDAEDLVPGTLQDWLQLAGQNDFEVVKRGIALELAQRESQRAKSDFMPSAQVVGNYSGGRAIYATGVENNAEHRQRSNSIGVTVSIPLFNGFGSNARYAETVHRLQTARAELDTARHDANAAVSRAFLACRTSLAQIEAARTTRDTAQFAMEAVSKGFEYGKRTVTDVSVAADKLFQAQRNLVAIQHGYHLNLIRLRVSTGQLDDEYLLQLSGKGAAQRPQRPPRHGPVAKAAAA